MPLFIYEAANKEGKIIMGEANAADSEAVVATLAQKQLLPVKIELKSDFDSHPLRSKNILERFTPQDRIALIRNLAATIKAGLSLNEALDILISDATKPIVKVFLLDVQLGIQNGQPLSAVFARNERYFPPLFVGMIKAGEASGKLDHALEDLSQHLSKEYKLIRKVKSALAYPLILLISSLGIISMMLIFVLPKLAKSFAQNNIQLPFLTRILVDISNALTYSFLLDLAIVVGLAVFLLYFIKSRRGKKIIAYLSFHLPAVKNLVRKIILVRFSRTLGSLIDSALSISESLNLTANAVSNPNYQAALLHADKEIRNGIPLSVSLKKEPELFPKFLTSLIAVGERTGSTGKVLKNFADFYEDDVDGALKDLTTFLEPLLLLFMGLIVGTIAVAILMPIYQMVGDFNY